MASHCVSLQIAMRPCTLAGRLRPCTWAGELTRVESPPGSAIDDPSPLSQGLRSAAHPASGVVLAEDDGTAALTSRASVVARRMS
eukprot:29352-Rhodomonas_salina.7